MDYTRIKTVATLFLLVSDVVASLHSSTEIRYLLRCTINATRQASSLHIYLPCCQSLHSIDPSTATSEQIRCWCWCWCCCWCCCWCWCVVVCCIPQYYIHINNNQAYMDKYVIFVFLASVLIPFNISINMYKTYVVLLIGMPLVVILTTCSARNTIMTTASAEALSVIGPVLH